MPRQYGILRMSDPISLSIEYQDKPVIVLVEADQDSPGAAIRERVFE